jgi:hypothetical protein
MNERRAITLGAALAGLVPLIVYAMTVQRTVPFWDSGEFIATAHVLGIPHPPGTPFFVLIGRLWSLLPVAPTALEVNFLSSIASVAAVVFTYLLTTTFISYWFYGAPGDRRRAAAPGGAPATMETAIQVGAGLVAAYFTAFSYTFWNNAVEAEVYAMSSAIMSGTAWLTLRWWERSQEPGSDNILLVIVYILSLSIGIHLGSFLVAPALFLFVIVVDWRRLLSGRELAAALVLLGAIALFAILRAAGSSLQASLAISLAGAALVTAFRWKKLLHRNLVAWFGILFVLGLSVHFYLLIRSRLHPSINEADPSNWKDLWLVVTRDQYKPGSPFERRAPWWYQINHMYLRYLSQQFVLGDWLGFVGRFVPLFLGMLGALAHWLREKKGFFFQFMLYFWTGIFLIFYLNFKEGEVRERDYFFVMSFHFFAIWIGMGVADLALRLRELVRPARVATAAILALGVLVSLLPLAHQYFAHDRSGNWVAYGYGHNMLVGLPEDAILLTNGDNDTFPLWYIQEVENFRKDVRVVNLSLLNTTWYLRQIRDIEPRVPITWDDAQIEGVKPIRQVTPGMTEPYAIPQRDRVTGQVLLLKDLAVMHIIQQNEWKRPLYIAVTVPDQMGLEKQLQMEGLVFRVHPQPPGDMVNETVALEMMDRKYDYRGLLDRDGFYDRSIYKDENEQRLCQNYAAARVRLAYQYARAGDIQRSLDQMESAAKISTDFPGVLDYLGGLYREAEDLARGESFMQQLMQRQGRSPFLIRYTADMQAESGRYGEAIELYREAIGLDPDLRDGYWNLFLTLWESGKRQEGLDVLDDWLKRRPDDSEVRRYRDAFHDSLAKRG